MNYAVHFAYSPQVVAFPDEFSHLYTLNMLLRTHGLRFINPILPVSTQYPGLELVTSALVQAGTPTSVAIVVVELVSHVLATCLFALLVYGISQNARATTVAVAVMALSPHYQSFDVLYAYGTLALPLALATVVIFRRYLLSAGRSGNVWLAFALLGATATAATHHVTAAFLCLVLVALSADAIATHSGVRSFTATVCSALLCVAVVATWLLVAASRTAAYLLTDLQHLLITGRAPNRLMPIITSASLGPLRLLSRSNFATPLGERTMTYGAVLITVTTLMLALRTLFHRGKGREGLGHGMLLSLSPMALIPLGLRVVSPGGGELAGRAFEYAFIPLAYTVGVGVTTWFAQSPARHFKSRLWRPGVAVLGICSLVVALGFNMAGWPAYFERMPGPFQPGGWERSFDYNQYDAARWALHTWGPGHRIAADGATANIFLGAGLQIPVGISAFYFLLVNPTRREAQFLRDYDAQYVAVDDRMATELPAGAAYFNYDPFAGRYTSPLPTADIDQFNGMPDVSRVYDNGTVQIYRVSK
ncbi:MAG TPA: hypothetical protein VFN61_16135 [Acidimicrobiales bacterium]|nr:hypothetical protein [Acidimicrobiales bacterium]